MKTLDNQTHGAAFVARRVGAPPIHADSDCYELEEAFIPHRPVGWAKRTRILLGGWRTVRGSGIAGAIDALWEAMAAILAKTCQALTNPPPGHLLPVGIDDGRLG